MVRKNGLLLAVAMLFVGSMQATDGATSCKMMSACSVKKALTSCAKMPKDMVRYAWYGIESQNPCKFTVAADRAFRILGIAAVAYHGYVLAPKVIAYLKAKLESAEAVQE